MKRYNICSILIVIICGITLFSCADEIETPDKSVWTDAAIGEPIELDFNMVTSSGQTRAVTPLQSTATVYVTPNKGGTYYRYKYDDTEGRWKCAETTPLTWENASMSLWAFVGNSESTARSISSNQAENGYESSDILAAFGNYSFTNGKVVMALDHKVAKLIVTVYGCIDPSIMTCTTASAFPNSASFIFGDNGISLSPGTTTDLFYLYRSSYNRDDEDVTKNTTTFTGYFLPNADFSTVFTLKCGSTITYNSSTISVPLKEGRTTQVNITLPSITSVRDFVPTSSGVGYAAVSTGSAQEFSAPITGWYKLEVWGANGGSYNYKKQDPNWSDYDLQMKGVSLCEGGTGAYVTGKLKLNKNDKLYVYVGKGGVGDVSNAEGPLATQTYGSASFSNLYKFYGGWNGGGTAVMDSYKEVRTSKIQDASITERREFGGGGAGGATDIALNNTGSDWKNASHLNTRIIIAGGGGGACYTPDQPGWYSGGGGGGGSSWFGEDGDGDMLYRGLAGTLTYTPANRGASHTGNGLVENGGFGYGGSCQWYGESLGGGGGGWYGGASGTGGGTNSAGGGGSSFAYSDIMVTAPYEYGNKATKTQTLKAWFKEVVGSELDAKYTLTDVSNLSGSFVETGTSAEGARETSWGTDGHARITLLTE